MLRLLIFCLSLSTLIASTETMRVEDILQPPPLSTIERALEARGGTYTPVDGAQIQELVQEILKGTYLPSYQPDKKQIPIEYMNMFLASKSGKALTTEVVKKLNRHLPALIYGHFVKRLLEACQSTHLSIARQKEDIAQVDHVLESSPILRTAHALALETVARLLFIMASPHGNPCDRMHALYILNMVHLCGSRGVALQRYRDRANRFYFTYDGLVREYDPSKNTAFNPKHIKAIDRFLRLVSHSKSQYQHFLSMGIRYGIILLQPYYDKATTESWSFTPPGFIWRYAATLFKEITTIDVIDMRTVTPEKIFAHQANRDFVKFMIHCSLKTPASLKEAKSLLNVYENGTEDRSILWILQQYYQESCSRS